MKRSKALAPLSRDHHHALVVARDLSRATDSSAATAARRFVEFLDHHELAHFAVEEAVLLPVITDEEPGRGLARRMLADHAALRESVRQLRDRARTPDVGWLRVVAQRLRDHVQMEERELFPYLEAVLPPPALEEIGSRLQASCERRR